MAPIYGDLLANDIIFLNYAQNTTMKAIGVA